MSQGSRTLGSNHLNYLPTPVFGRSSLFSARGFLPCSCPLVAVVRGTLYELRTTHHVVSYVKSMYAAFCPTHMRCDPGGWLAAMTMYGQVSHLVLSFEILMQWRHLIANNRHIKWQSKCECISCSSHILVVFLQRFSETFFSIHNAQ